MAFTAKTMHYSNGAALPAGGRARLCHYATTDALTDAAGNDYFNEAAAFLPVGSVISVSAVVGGTEEHQDYIVSANDGTTVTLTEAKIA